MITEESVSIDFSDCRPDYVCQLLEEEFELPVQVGSCSFLVKMKVEICYDFEAKEEHLLFEMISYRPAGSGPSQACIQEIISAPDLQAKIDQIEKDMIYQYQISFVNVNSGIINPRLCDETNNDYFPLIVDYFQASCSVRCLNAELGEEDDFDFFWAETACEGSGCCIISRGICLEEVGGSVIHVYDSPRPVEGEGCNTVEAPCRVSDSTFGTCRDKEHNPCRSY